MELVIHNRLISAPVDTILRQVRLETHGRYLHQISGDKNGNIMVTCPYHKDGNESHPSCSVLARDDDPNLPKGTAHCFTCGKSVSLASLIGYCFDQDNLFGEEWLVEKFGDTYIINDEYLPPIDLAIEDKPVYLDESILDKYRYFHPYMFQRGLDEATVRKFHVGYDSENDAITFPIWDMSGRLIGVTERSVNTKRFYIPDNIDKPIYLLNYIVNENIDTVWVCESQLNTLLCWKRGHPAIGFIGTGTNKQYDILKRSGIRHYYLALDGDEAGDKGIIRFMKNMPNDVLIDIVDIPRGKDIADLSDEEFSNLKLKGTNLNGSYIL